VGNVFCANDSVETCLLHLFTAQAETGELRHAAAKFGDELCAVVVSAGFSGGQKDARIGWCGDRTSVDFS
jgi:hypothetical protein